MVPLRCGRRPYYVTVGCFQKAARCQRGMTQDLEGADQMQWMGALAGAAGCGREGSSAAAEVLHLPPAAKYPWEDHSFSLSLRFHPI